MHSVILLRLLGAVSRERARQDMKFGHQDYPLTDPLQDNRWGPFAEHWKSANDEAMGTGTRTGDGVLLEEVYEALSATTPAEIVTELVQVAAVALLLAEMQIRHHPETAPGGPVRFNDNIKTGMEGHHRYNGGDRLHGMCRCGELSGNVIHFCPGHTDTEDRPLDAVQFDGHCSLCHLPVNPVRLTVDLPELPDHLKAALGTAIQTGDGNTQNNTFG